VAEARHVHRSLRQSREPAKPDIRLGIWNALKATPEKAINAIKSGLPGLWNSITNAFKNNPVAAWGTAIGTTILTLLGGYTALCGLSSTLSLLQLAGMFSLPLAGLLTTDKKHRLYGLFAGLMFCGMILSACAPQGGSPTSTPTFCLPPDTPAPTQTPAPAQTPVPPTATATALPTYVVQPGDNLFTIAKSTGMCADEIAKASGISDMNAILSVGTILTLAPCKYGFTPTPPSRLDQPPSIPPSDSSHQQQAMQMFDYMVDLADYCGRYGSAAQTVAECPWWAKDGVVTQAEIIELIAFNEFQSTENYELIELQKDDPNNPNDNAVNTTKRGTTYLRVQWENVNQNCAGNISQSSSDSACRKALAEFLGEYQIWYQSDSVDTLEKFGKPESHNEFDPYFYKRYWDTGGDGDDSGRGGLEMSQDVLGNTTHYADSTCFLNPNKGTHFNPYNYESAGLVYENATYNGNLNVWVIFMTEAQWKQNMHDGQVCPMDR